MTTCRPCPIRKSFLRESGNLPETRKFVPRKFPAIQYSEITWILFVAWYMYKYLYYLGYVYYELNAPLKSRDFRCKHYSDRLLTFPHTSSHPQPHTHPLTLTPTPSHPQPHTLALCWQDLFSLCPDYFWDDQLISLIVETNPEDWITLNSFLAFWT